jgi:CPA1 family monovalent cation:H+ antiporter
MYTEKIMLVAGLLFVVSLLTILADKLKISYPIFLVIAGCCISFIPGVPRIRLDPDVVFVIFLPPLLYAAAWGTSWPDFWRSRRAISLLALGLVLFTSTIVAYVTNHMIADFNLALGFLLGGIISPPDAVAATSVTKGLSIPRRVTTILEGESLVNDASSLIVYRFALAAFVSGSFSIWKAGGDFFMVSVMGVLIGLAIAHIVYAAHRFLPTNSSVDTALTLISPYFAYLAAEHFHFSGVLAVVSAGLFLTWRSSDIFSFQTRIQTISVWNTIVFLLNGVVFIMIGLQLPDIIEGLGEYSLHDSIIYGLIVSGISILMRIIWVFAGAYLPHLLSSHVRKTEERPNWQSVFIIAWSGMRGVVSLAAALALPITLDNGTVFQQRNLILFITFIVIVITLVIQGLSLPLIIKWLGVNGDEDNIFVTEKELRLNLAYSAIEHIEETVSNQEASQDAIHHIKSKYERRIDQANEQMLTIAATEHSADLFREYNMLQISLIHFERDTLRQMRRQKTYSEELIRKLEFELDLEEARLLNIRGGRA